LVSSERCDVVYSAAELFFFLSMYGFFSQSPNLVYDSELIGLPLDNDQLEIINCTKEILHNHLNISSSFNETDCNWWVKTKLDENHYLVSASRGFHVWNAIAQKLKGKKE